MSLTWSGPTGVSNKFQHEYITSTALPGGSHQVIDKTATNIANLAEAVRFQRLATCGLSGSEKGRTDTEIIKAATLGKTKDMGYNREWTDEIQYKLAGEFLFNERLTLMASECL